MEFNPNIIKDGVDNDIYGEVCPTLGTLMLARYSTPKKNNPVIYSVDKQFFELHPLLSMYVRRAFPGEFDVAKTVEQFDRIPKLWVLVTKLCEGTHEITPRWRGSRYWKDAESNEAVAELMVEFAEKGALNLSEWFNYVCDQRVNNADQSRLRKDKSGSKKDVVH